MATILSQVPLTATADVLLVSAAQGHGPAGWRLGFLGASWTGSVVLKADMGAPGQAQSLTTIPFITESTGATNTAGTAITATGNYLVQPNYCGYDLYASYTHTSGSCVVTTQTQDGATASGDLTAANLDGSASQNTFGANVPYTGTYAFPGSVTGAFNGTLGATTPAAVTGTTGTFTGDVSVSKTISSATPSTERLTLSEVTLSGTTIAIAAGGSIAGVRGAITIPTGKTFTEGFLYGTQGKVTLVGTINEGAAARIAGVLGQVDLSTGTVTAGQVSALWGDFQGTPTMTTPDQVNIVRATNSSNATVNAVLMAYGKASYFATFGADGGAANVAYWGTVAPTSLAKSLKILGPDGTPYYIGCYSAAS